MTSPTATSCKRKYESPELTPNKAVKTESFDLDALPAEIAAKVLSELDIPELINTSFTNKKFHELSNFNSVWKQIAKKIGCPTEIETLSAQIRVKNHIEDLRIKVNELQQHKYAPTDIEAILSKKLTIEQGVFLNKFVNSWSQFILFCELADQIRDEDTLERLCAEKTSAEIIKLAEEFSTWFETNKIQLINEITSLNLRNSTITEIPREIFLLTRLTDLYLQSNFIERIPSEIGQLTQLQCLLFSDNLIKTIPSEIDQLTGLFRLELDDNQIAEIPSEIGKLIDLTFLNLGDNLIAEIPSTIGKLDQLEFLYFNNNKIAEIPSEIGELGELFELDFSYNQIKEIPSKIGELGELCKLDFSYNQIKEIPSFLPSMQNGCQSYFAGNPIAIIKVGTAKIFLSPKLLPPFRKQVEDYIEDLRIKVNALQQHKYAPMDIEAIVSKDLTIEKVAFINQFVNSWSKFIIFCKLADQITDKDTLERLNGAKTSAEIIKLAEEFSTWFETNKIQLINEITSLNLRNSTITEIPREIFLLTRLTDLYLQSNFIERIPSEIGQLTQLKCLLFSDNLIKTIPSEIGQLTVRP